MAICVDYLSVSSPRYQKETLPLFMCSSFAIFALIELDNVSSGWVCGLHLSNVPTSKTFNQRKVLKTVVKVYSEVRRQKMALFRTLNETVGGWGSKVPNF